jgi:two-component system, response regulator
MYFSKLCSDFKVRQLLSKNESRMRKGCGRPQCVEERNAKYRKCDVGESTLSEPFTRSYTGGRTTRAPNMCFSSAAPEPGRCCRQACKRTEDKLILLIEDNPDDQALTLRALQKNHIKNEVVVVSDGAEALDFLYGRGGFAGRDLSEMPEITLLDLNLPKISGLEVLRQMRADDRTRLLPVVILTTSDEEQDRLRSYDVGANSYVRKPVEFEQFMEVVRELGLYWLVLNRRAPVVRNS